MSTKTFDVAEIAQPDGSWGITTELDDEVEATIETLVPDPLTPLVVITTEATEFTDLVHAVTSDCQKDGGYVEDIKLSTAGVSPHSITYTAIVMCRKPAEENDES